MIRRFRALGWTGPFPGKRHMVMRRGDFTVQIPNPHGGDIDWSLTKRILQRTGITTEQWDNLMLS